MYLLANLVSIINNTIKLKKDYADVPYSILIQKCLMIMLNEGFILGYNQYNSKTFRIYLKYYKGKSVINGIKCISLPGFRKYIKITDLINKYNLSTLIILSTSEGIISNFDLLLNRNLNNKINLLKKKNININYEGNLMKKNIKFTDINLNLNLNYTFNKFLKYNLNNTLFHKRTILKSAYRKTGIISQLSKRQYFRNKELKLYLYNYINKNYFNIKNNNVNNINFIHLKKNMLTLNKLKFFKFKNFFKDFQYLKFKKWNNFKNFISLTNNNHFFSVFYFLFFIKQFSFSNYKFRFSIYLKYLNQLIKLKSIENKLNYKERLKKIPGGEPLLLVY